MRVLYLTLAGVFFTLAVLGIALPVLPTTPFLLLTSWCLVRSSPALNARLRNSPLFGPMLRDWDEHHGVRLHVKVTAFCVLAAAVAASSYFGELDTWLRVVLFAGAGIGAFVIVRLKTVRD
jgi:uncharacterized membrane protein YbaN (DUF454 family)